MGPTELLIAVLGLFAAVAGVTIFTRGGKAKGRRETFVPSGIDTLATGGRAIIDRVAAEDRSRVDAEGDAAVGEVLEAVDAPDPTRAAVSLLGKRDRR